MAGNYWRLSDISPQPHLVMIGEEHYEQKYMPSTDSFSDQMLPSQYYNQSVEPFGDEPLPYYTYRNPSRHYQRRPITRILAPTHMVNANVRPHPSLLVPPHYMLPHDPVFVQREPNQALPHERPQIQRPWFHKEVYKECLPRFDTSDRYPSGPLVSPWPHDKSFKKPYNISMDRKNISQSSASNRELEERQSVYSRQSRPNRYEEVNVETIYRRTGKRRRGHKRRSFNTLRSNDSNVSLRSNQTDTDQSQAQQSTLDITVNTSTMSSEFNLQLVPAQYVKSEDSGKKDKKVNSLFNITAEPCVHSVDTLMRLYWRIYQCYTPVNLYQEKEKLYKWLSEAIWQTHQMRQPAIRTYICKLTIWKQLLVLLSRYRPDHQYNIYLTGSTLSGLSFSTSDMDLCLVAEERPGIPSRYNAIFHLKCIKYLLDTVKEIEAAEIIEAKVPLLRFTVVGEETVSVDMNCNNTVSIANTQLVYAYTRCDWRFQPLYSTIKQWAIFKNINEPLKRTLSSYTISLLLIQFLQCGVNPPVLPCLHNIVKSDFNWKDIAKHSQLEIFKYWHIKESSQNEQSLGELLMSFFQFYTNINFKEYVISVRLGRPIRRSEYRKLNTPLEFNDSDFIVVEEPFTLTNTAYSVYSSEAYLRIITAFYQAFHNLEKSYQLDALFK